MNKAQQLRLTNLLLLVSFFFVYLEWGKGNSAFLFDVLREIIAHKSDPLKTLTHPIVLSGIIGIGALVSCILMPKPNRWLNLLAVSLPALIVLFISLIGAFGLNYRIFISTLPFLILTLNFFRLRINIKREG